MEHLHWKIRIVTFENTVVCNCLVYFVPSHLRSRDRDHRYALASKTLPTELRAVLDEVIAMVNAIKASPLSTRLFGFRLLCLDFDEQQENLLYHTEVCWLSKGIMLEREVSLKKKWQNSFHKTAKQSRKSSPESCWMMNGFWNWTIWMTSLVVWTYWTDHCKAALLQSLTLWTNSKASSWNWNYGNKKLDKEDWISLKISLLLSLVKTWQEFKNLCRSTSPLWRKNYSPTSLTWACWMQSWLEAPSQWMPVLSLMTFRMNLWT